MMKIKQKRILQLSILFFGFLIANISYAPTTLAEGTCGKAKTILVTCTGGEGGAALGDVFKQVVVILGAAVGAIAVGGIAYGAVLYASAQDNAGQTSQAIGVIRNVAIGIVLYIFMIAIINWLVPGAIG